jgi:type IV fimbrial biogenesis protein FimT
VKRENLKTMVDAPVSLRGFTLIELMVTIAILAITLGLAVPSFQEFVARNRLAAATNELVSALALARSEAVKRAARVTVASADWTAGWQVFVDTGTVGDAADDTVLRVQQSTSNAAPSVTPDDNFADYISYLPSGVSQGNGGASNGSFEVCKAGVSRVISISTTGRVSTTSGAC